jgi:hypothetical protein
MVRTPLLRKGHKSCVGDTPWLRTCQSISLKSLFSMISQEVRKRAAGSAQSLRKYIGRSTHGEHDDREDA